LRHTKIVCTIGPASESLEVLQAIIEAGMDVARLNFSHGTHEEHRRRIEGIRQAAAAVGKTVAILLDTRGPEIRVGKMEGGRVTLTEGAEVVLTTQELLGTPQRISVNYLGLPREVKAGDRVLIDDGLIELVVLAVEGEDIRCRVVNGGEVSDRKGVNVPGVEVALPAVTDQDLEDILFGIAMKVDFIAASFIRRPEDVLAIRRILEEHGADIHIIAKIENQSGVKNAEDILKVADGIMVARGDLGVEIPVEEVPLVQKDLINLCNMAGKPVITATQMLDSMMRNPRPTRAEASDVANAIMDGTDAIMLSGETAAGRFPVEAVRTMARLAERTEQALDFPTMLRQRGKAFQRTVTDAISHATCTISLDLQAEAIITPTTSGSTARMVSKYRPACPVVAASPNADVLRKLSLVWGVIPVLVPITTGTDQMISAGVAAALEAGVINSGDLTVITAGVPVGVPGTTNLIKVHIVGEIRARGMGIGQRVAVGTVRIVHTAEEAETKIREGDILVTISTDRDFVPAMERSAAIITETGGLTSHAAIVGLNLGVPVVVGVDHATERLADGETVTVDGSRGVIYRGVTKVL